MMTNATTNKLILLYIFDQMETPLSEETLIEICNENDWLSYMDCKQAISELINSSFITNVGKTSSPIYVITNDGSSCLIHFPNKIPLSIRESIKEEVSKNRINYRKRQEYFSDYFKNDDGTYTVILKILPSTEQQPLLELKLNIPSRITAKWIYKNWKDKAAVIYELINENLIE